MALGRHSNFNDLLHPIDVQLFFEEVYERRPMLVQRNDAAFYSGIFGLEDVDAMLQSPVVASKFVRVNQQGQEIVPSRWSRGEEMDADAVSQLFAGGATVILNGAQRFFRRLESYCNNVERQMRFGVQPNIYMTPANSRGFDRHYDDHDVFIMQVHGTKHWRLYGSPIELPSRSQRHEAGKYESLPLKESFVLEPGDLLYIPRGHLHDAATNGAASIHITFGLHPPYLYELVQEIVRRCQESPGFRRAIPGLMKRVPRESFAARFKQQLHAIVDEVDVEDLLNAMDRRFITWRHPSRESRFRDLLGLADVHEMTRVTPTRSVIYRLDRVNGEVHLRVPGTDLKFPSFLEDTLRTLLESESFTIADIPGLLDGAGRIALVRRLIAAGLLQLVD